MLDKLKSKLLPKTKKDEKFTKFFIFFYERSGSTYLCDLLNNHPEIQCEMETFWLDWDLPKKASLAKRRQFSKKEALKTLDELYSNSNKDNKSVGFKFKYPGQSKAYPEVWNHLASNSNDFKVIFLYRVNKLRAIVSSLNRQKLLEKHKITNVKQGDKIILEPVEIDINEVKKMVWKRHKIDEEHFKLVKKHFSAVLPVAYEDLCRDKNKTVDNILKFLEIEKTHELVSRFKKAGEKDFDKLILNYDELIESLMCTPFEIYLRSD